MGAKESKQSCINYEDAIKRVSEAELRRLKEAFKKSAGVGRLYLSRNAFQQDVLCEGVPASITDLLYAACGGTAKGISFKDLLCGLVVITRGSDYEKTKLLWNLCCHDSGAYIQKFHLLKSFNLHSCESASLFTQGQDRISFEQFENWILRNRHCSELSKWLLTDNCLSLTSELETPTFYQSLAGVTHLEEKDIGDLEKEFWRLKNASPNGQLDLQFIGPLLSPPIPKNALQGLFNAFDENRDGHIDFKELCCGVSAACRGPGVERTRFCFKIFDVDRDGMLNSEETSQMINVLLFVAKERGSTNQCKNISKLEALEDISKFTADKLSVQKSPTSATTTNSTNNIDNCTLMVEDFMMWNVDSTLKLLQPFLDLIFEVCHIIFGLWPQCRHMEYDIVKGWLEREERRNYRVGQFWYLISHDWWLNWLQYANNKNIPCNYCKLSNSNNNGTRNANSNCTSIDEALVCDESFNTSSLESVGDAGILSSDDCSLGSASSGISTGRHIGLRPGPIDNSNLVAPNLYKNVRTLTGEGGHLKKDTPLVQSHHFELIPKSLWKALNRWYGDSLPLPRQVIQPPNSAEVELELYPLNLRILLHQNANQNQMANNWGGAIPGGYSLMASGGSFAAIASSNVLQPPKRYLAYTAAFSRLATVQQVGAFLCSQLRLRTEDIRLWHIPHGLPDNTAILLDEDNITLKELLIRDDDQILMEIRNKDQTWPEELGSLTLNQTSGTNITNNDRRLTRTSIMSIQVPGATGLHNLGNTCFMNAALQVLFNTQPLAQYFRQNMHLYELNVSNKLGTRGQLATRYGELLKEVWNATTRSVAPLKLRFCVTKHAPQFAGGGQHDSQELLEWLLDALHEDLNRVMDKPYSELKDSNGRPDKIVAAEAWAQHHARNQSIIIDLFYGQLKSKVSCLCCGRESVRFDPFSLLSLPLPVENYVYFEVLVILLDGSVPIKYGLRLNSESKYCDLKRELEHLSGLHSSLMCICEVWNSQIRCILSDDEKVRSQSTKELYVYQLPEKNYRSSSQSSSTLGANIEQGLKDIQRSAVTLNVHDSFNSLNMLNTTTINNNGNNNNNHHHNNNNDSHNNNHNNSNNKNVAFNCTNASDYITKSNETLMASSTTTTATTTSPLTTIKTKQIDNDNQFSTKQYCEYNNALPLYITTATTMPSKATTATTTTTIINTYSHNNNNNNNKFNSMPRPITIADNCTIGGAGAANAADIGATTITDVNIGVRNGDDDGDGDDGVNDNNDDDDENGGVNVYNNADDDDDDDVQVATKVRRCFGNTMCMPQNLLCFKHSHNLSRSPENSFNIGIPQKRISSSKLLAMEAVTGQHSGGNSIESSMAELTLSSSGNNTTMSNDNFQSINSGDCPCRHNILDGDGNLSQKYLRNDLQQQQQQQQKTEAISNGTCNLGNDSTFKQLKAGKYLIAVHRKITRQDSYFLSHHKTRPSIFGIPLIIPNTDGGTHKDLYCAVWLQVSRLLSPLPAVTDQANHAADCDDSLGYDFPFSLRAVKSDGLSCALCQWSNFCRGCEIPCNNDYIMQGLFNNNSDSDSFAPNLLGNSSATSTTNSDASNATNSTSVLGENFTIAIDWDPTALHLRYQSTLEKLWIDHETLAMCRREQIEPVDLNHCLKAFTSEERLEQWYHCSHCKGKKPATKKLQIWKLPPILIVHLKRFNCVNGKWAKSQKVVHFPFDNFDPAPYLAAVPQETILRHHELLTMKQTGNNETLMEENETISENDNNIIEQKPSEQLNLLENTNRTYNNPVRISSQNADTLPKDNHLNEALNNIINLQNHHHTQTLDNCSNIVQQKVLEQTKDVDGNIEMQKFRDDIQLNNVMAENQTFKDEMIMRRERLISTSLTKTPIIDGYFEDYHQHKLKSGEDKFDPKYKLYAVVSHSGMLSGGHYVSYAANPNGNWYCYNDSSCREIASPPNIDPCSAYLLFYERKGLDYEPYIPNIEGKSLPNGGLGILEMDENENDLKKLCTIT